MNGLYQRGGQEGVRGQKWQNNFYIYHFNLGEIIEQAMKVDAIFREVMHDGEQITIKEELSLASCATRAVHIKIKDHRKLIRKV